MKNIAVRIGWELLLPIALIVFLPTLLSINDKNWETLFIPLAIFFLVILLMITIRYSIDSKILYIKNSIFGTTKINISDISKLEKTWNLISSPAPAIIGRIEIYYQNNSVIISPKNYEEFKNSLLKINPNITIKE